MEAQGGGGGGGGGSGEVRRIHIIYFLSRKGRIDHPHLIRVHHFSRNGVRLRDVKRWLSELRGKDMPHSFAWSYKRRYKTGYVWQDLLDEDLITPISDNEYVLKGSEIPFNLDFLSHSHGEKKLVSMEKEPTSLDETANSRDHHKKPCREEIHEEHPETTMDVSTKTSPPLGSEASTTTDEDPNNKKETTEKSENNFSSFYSTLLNRKKINKKNKIEKNNVDNNNNPSTPASSSSTSTSTTSSSYSFTKSKSNSSGASNIIRNIISCGAVDTDESVMVMIKRRDKSSSYMPIPDATKNKPDENNGTSDHCITAEICRGDKLGGSERIFGTSWNQQEQTHTYARRRSCDGMKSSSNAKSEFSNQKPVSAAYKPVNGPNCSQCGKMFKPEKMHAHMKSCKGMKSLAKGATPPPPPSHAAAAARASVLEPSRSSIEESLPSNY